MMGNNVIRAEGKAKFAMVAMIIPLLSILHWYSFIKYLHLGMFVLLWLSHILFYLFLVLCFGFYFKKRTAIKMKHYLKYKLSNFHWAEFVTFLDKASWAFYPSS
jgi:hypothetical protein